jgi:hypothetical protein
MSFREKLADLVVSFIGVGLDIVKDLDKLAFDN